MVYIQNLYIYLRRRKEKGAPGTVIGISFQLIKVYYQVSVTSYLEQGFKSAFLVLQIEHRAPCSSNLNIRLIFFSLVFN